jgi:hypothetical protein
MIGPLTARRRLRKGQRFGAIPMPTAKTWQFPGLCMLLNLYLRLAAPESKAFAMWDRTDNRGTRMTLFSTLILGLEGRCERMVRPPMLLQQHRHQEAIALGPEAELQLMNQAIVLLPHRLVV